jgi:hypothetical protein
VGLGFHRDARGLTHSGEPWNPGTYPVVSLLVTFVAPPVLGFKSKDA